MTFTCLAIYVSLHGSSCIHVYVGSHVCRFTWEVMYVCLHGKSCVFFTWESCKKV